MKVYIVVKSSSHYDENYSVWLSEKQAKAVAFELNEELDEDDDEEDNFWVEEKDVLDS